MDSRGLEPECPGDFLGCLVDCLSSYPGLDLAFWGLGIGLGLNFKFPWEVRPGASWFTSLDRRLPSWMMPKVNTGATVIRGRAGRIKFLGRFGTLAAALAGFSGGYIAGAGGVCIFDCLTR